MIITNRKISYPDCKVILSHAGGTLPFLITRVCTVPKEAAATARIYGKSSKEIMEDFRSFDFDLAFSSSEVVLKLGLDVIPHDHITYGSDFGYASPDKSLGFKQILDGFPLDPELRDKILRTAFSKLYSSMALGWESSVNFLKFLARRVMGDNIEIEIMNDQMCHHFETLFHAHSSSEGVSELDAP
ncbi:amidohydrolase family protein [Penicillium macrosclerotiorum]|uniref:amidohydrolase family protein n=1 Tax=Penicillium macrosclerotiorum TaxID=303699 RepID=UPI002548AD2C|nr:amidohydrolase family protein [Penicillium macrosclerotiorum]KAJ5675499.1 amidohydrolase family protein [Penicillium macrosclerotiorum]